ncbi:hypothetical protein Dimus_024583 [Dionaea muscipula]
MTVIHLKKKDVVKSSVKGIGIEFDHERLATILGVPGRNGMCEYIKENVIPRFGKRDTSSYMDLTYMDHLMARSFWCTLVNKKGEDPKRYDYFEETFLTMCKLRREDGIWWIGSGENRRRDNDVDAPEEEAEKEDERNKDDFDWEAVIDEATVEGESGSDDQFYDAQVEVDEPSDETPRRPSDPSFIFTQEKIKNLQESTPRAPLADFQKLNF